MENNKSCLFTSFDEEFTLERKMWKISDVYFRDQEKNLTCNDMLTERDVTERERERERERVRERVKKYLSGSLKDKHC